MIYKRLSQIVVGNRSDYNVVIIRCIIKGTQSVCPSDVQFTIDIYAILV